MMCMAVREQLLNDKLQSEQANTEKIFNKLHMTAWC